MNLQKLRERVQRSAADTNDTLNNQQMKNIAFCSAGNLSKGSRGRLNAHRDKLGKVTEKSIAGQFTLSIAEGKPLELFEIQQKFITCSTPVEMERYNHLVCAHPNGLCLGDADLLARLVIAKFDKRLAKSMRILIIMGSREFSLDPSKSKAFQM